MTPTDLIKLTLKACRVLGQGQNATQQQLNDALSLLNMMMGQWARKRWLVFHLVELYVVGTGANAYALGPDGDFTPAGDVRWDEAGISWDVNTGIRASRIESAFVRLNAGTPGQTDLPVSVIAAYEDWASIPAKNVQGGLPQIVFLNTGYPVATVNVWPQLSSLYELHILVLSPLARLARLDTDINMPDEYQEALMYNLARRLMSFYGKAPDPEINGRAIASLATVKAANTQIPLLRMPRAVLSGGLGTYNVYTDN